MPNYYAEINKEGRVLGMSELSEDMESSLLIPLTKEQFENQNLLFARYIEGSFIGHYCLLEADKQSIAANGDDVMTITATVFTWENEVDKNYSEEIEFEVNGYQQTVKAVKGKAALTLSSEEPGEYIVRTTNLGRNSELKVVVAHAS